MLGGGFLDKVDGRLNAYGYIDALENSFLPSTTMVFTPILSFNAPCHTAGTVRSGSMTKGLLR